MASNIFKAIDLTSILAYAVTPQMQGDSGIGYSYQLKLRDTDGKILDAIVWDSFEVTYVDDTPANNQRFVVRNDGLMLSTISLGELLPLVDPLKAVVHDMSGAGPLTITIAAPQMTASNIANQQPCYLIDSANPST